MDNDEITQKILARVSILSNYPISNINLIKNTRENSLGFDDESIEICYTDEGSLAHELSHACFTPNFLYNRIQQVKHGLLNALEDYRIEKCMSLTDKYLFKLIENQIECLDPKKFNKAPDEIKKLGYIALQDKFKPLINIPDKDKEILDRACKMISDNPFDWFSTIQAYSLLENLFTDTSKNKNKGSNEIDEDSESQIVKEAKQMRKRGYKECTPMDIAKKTHVETRINLADTLKKIRKDLVDKKYNTNKGRLNTKRIGLYPNTMLFKKTDKVKKIQRLTIIYDVSDSMRGGNDYAVIGFLKAVKQAENRILKVNYIAFAIRAKEEFIQDTNEFRYLCGELGGGTVLVSAIDLIEKKINIQERNTIIIITDGETYPIQKSRIKKLESIAQVHCIVIGARGRTLIESGFSNIMKIDDIREIPDKLRLSLVKGK